MAAVKAGEAVREGAEAGVAVSVACIANRRGYGSDATGREGTATGRPTGLWSAWCGINQSGQQAHLGGRGGGDGGCGGRGGAGGGRGGGDGGGLGNMLPESGGHSASEVT